MKLRSTFLLLLCFLVVALYYFFLPVAPNNLLVSVESYKESTELFSINAEYPQFPRLPKEFNEKVKASVFEEIARFKEIAREKDSSLDIGWTQEQLNSNTLSIIVRFSSYTGGAHGARWFSTFNYDVANKKEITLDSLFASVPNYLGRISQFALNDLKSQMGSDANVDMIQTGTAPKVENFSLFTLENSDTIVFHFLEYQVAPYVAGEWRVSMPISYLKHK